MEQFVVAALGFVVAVVVMAGLAIGWKATTTAQRLCEELEKLRNLAEQAKSLPESFDVIAKTASGMPNVASFVTEQLQSLEKTVAELAKAMGLRARSDEEMEQFVQDLMRTGMTRQQAEEAWAEENIFRRGRFVP